VYVGAEACPACGYQESVETTESKNPTISEEKHITVDNNGFDALEGEYEKQKIKSVENLEGIYKRWKIDAKSGGNKKIFFTVLKWVGFAVRVVVAVISLIFLSKYSEPKNVIDKYQYLLKFKKVLTVICVLIVFAYSIGWIAGFGDLFLNLKLANWLKVQKVDIAEELLALKKVEEGKVSTYFKKLKIINAGDELKTAYYLSKNQEDKNIYRNLQLSRQIVSMIFVIVLAVVLFQFMYKLGAVIALEIDDSLLTVKSLLSFVSTGAWIFFVLAFLAKIALWIVYRCVYLKKQKEWCHSAKV